MPTIINNTQINPAIADKRVMLNYLFDLTLNSSTDFVKLKIPENIQIYVKKTIPS